MSILGTAIVADAKTYYERLSWPRKLMFKTNGWMWKSGYISGWTSANRMNDEEMKSSDECWEARIKDAYLSIAREIDSVLSLESSIKDLKEISKRIHRDYDTQPEQQVGKV